jgi:hypothetical protein
MWWATLRFAVNATQILRPGGITRIFAATCDEQDETNKNNYPQKTQQRMMHKVSTAFLMRKLRKKSSERSVAREADVIPSGVEEWSDRNERHGRLRR